MESGCSTPSVLQSDGQKQYEFDNCTVIKNLMQYAGLGITKTKKIIFLTNKKRRLGGGHLKLNYTLLSYSKGSEES